MLLGDGQGGTVDPLVNLFPFLRLEGVEPFPSVTHPGDTVAWKARWWGPRGTHTCAWLGSPVPQALWETGRLSPWGLTRGSNIPSGFDVPGGGLNALQE